MTTRFLAISLLVLAVSASASASSFDRCSGTAKYKITFFNFLTKRNFGRLIPDMGLVFSPLAGASHSGRISILTVRGFASEPVEDIAERGDNTALVKLAKRLRKKKLGVKDLDAATGPTMPGNSTTLELMVDCDHSFVTVLGMVAPSPDWIVQISNLNLFSSRFGKYVPYLVGYLIAYDAGTDSGREFTDPGNADLDEPTDPKQNIAPLVEDETDRFEGKIIGKYFVRRTP